MLFYVVRVCVCIFMFHSIIDVFSLRPDELISVIDVQKQITYKEQWPLSRWVDYYKYD